VGFAGSQLYAGLSVFYTLKLKILSASRAEFRREPWTHSSVEREFRRCAPRDIRADYAKFVLPCYERIRPGLRYMDVRWDDSQSDELIARVRDALIGRKAFSLIRLSDREGYPWTPWIAVKPGGSGKVETIIPGIRCRAWTHSRWRPAGAFCSVEPGLTVSGWKNPCNRI
jgi:hypothetical protein